MLRKIRSRTSSHVYVHMYLLLKKERLSNEVQEVLNEMPYLHACVMENFRIVPPVSLHNRLCIKDTEVRGSFWVRHLRIK